MLSVLACYVDSAFQVRALTRFPLPEYFCTNFTILPSKRPEVLVLDVCRPDQRGVTSEPAHFPAYLLCLGTAANSHAHASFAAFGFASLFTEWGADAERKTAPKRRPAAQIFSEREHEFAA